MNSSICIIHPSSVISICIEPDHDDQCYYSRSCDNSCKAISSNGGDYKHSVVIFANGWQERQPGDISLLDSFVLNIKQHITIIYNDQIIWLTYDIPPNLQTTKPNMSPTLVSNVMFGMAIDRMSALLQLHLNSRLNTWLQCIWQRELQDVTRNI